MVSKTASLLWYRPLALADEVLCGLRLYSEQPAVGEPNWERPRLLRPAPEPKETVERLYLLKEINFLGKQKTPLIDL